MRTANFLGSLWVAVNYRDRGIAKSPVLTTLAGKRESFAHSYLTPIVSGPSTCLIAREVDSIVICASDTCRSSCLLNTDNGQLGLTELMIKTQLPTETSHRKLQA